jgi:hypothetical protein
VVFYIQLLPSVKKHMPDTPQALADRLRGEGGRVVDFFNHLSTEQWEILVYPQVSNWSLHHLLAHFVSSEVGRKELIAYVFGGDKGAPPDFEIDLFNQQEVVKLSVNSSVELLQRFNQEREILIELVSTMSPQDLTRKGNDPYLGVVSLSEIIKLTYRHLQIHLRDARRCL